MALAKKYRFEQHRQEIADYALVFLHPARHHILELLGKQGGATFPEIAEGIPLHQATVSEHIKLLKRFQLLALADLPTGETGYVLRDDQLDKMLSDFITFVQQLQELRSSRHQVVSSASLASTIKFSDHVASILAIFGASILKLTETFLSMKSHFISLLFILLLITACGNTVSVSREGGLAAENYRLVGSKLGIDTLFAYEDIIWGFTWLNDQQVLATEKSGKLLLISEGAATEIAGMPDIFSMGQGGLLDVATHPKYPENGWIYVTYSASKADAATGNTSLVRFKLEGGQAVSNFEELYHASPDTDLPYHFGSRIAWQDGYVFFSVGDRGNRDENPQDISRDGGKIYRLNEDGTIPSTNPFIDSLGAKTAIYSYGHRNPQGLALNPFTNEIWETEHGPRGGDELNIIQPGLNYGWPIVTYGINYDGTQITQEQKKDGMQDPIHYWVPSIAPSGMAFVTSDVYPGWQGDILVGSLSFSYLEHLLMDGTTVVGREKLIPNLGRVRDVRVGPDGHIYVSVEGTGIVRLLPN